MGVKVGVAVGMSVSVGKGEWVGVRVSVGSGDGSSVAEGSGERVCVESNREASLVAVMGGATWVGVLLTGWLQAGRLRNKAKITQIRFMWVFNR
jgi:hypothetical protein